MGQSQTREGDESSSVASENATPSQPQSNPASPDTKNLPQLEPTTTTSSSSTPSSPLPKVASPGPPSQPASSLVEPVVGALQRLLVSLEEANKMCQRLTPSESPHCFLFSIVNFDDVQDRLSSTNSTGNSHGPNSTPQQPPRIVMMGALVDSMEQHYDAFVVQHFAKIGVWKVGLPLRTSNTSNNTSSSSSSSHSGSASVSSVSSTASTLPPGSHLNDKELISVLRVKDFLKLQKCIRTHHASCGGSVNSQTAGFTLVSSPGSPPKEECCVCMEEAVTEVLPCGHGYCTECNQKWNEVRKTCPQCRRELTKGEVANAWELTDAPSMEDVLKDIETFARKLDRQRSRSVSPGKDGENVEATCMWLAPF